MNKRDYRADLSHPLWREKRKQVFQRFGRKCSRCGSRRLLDVHHKTYSNGKRAWEYPLDNFEILCQRCHAAAHNRAYSATRCGTCGTEIRAGFAHCASCHSQLAQKYRQDLAKKNLELSILQDQLKVVAGSKTPASRQEFERLDKEREILVLQKEAAEEKMKELEETTDDQMRQIGSQIGSLRRILVGMAILLVLVVAVFLWGPGFGHGQATAKETAEAGPSYLSAAEAAHHVGERVAVRARVSQVTYARNGNIYLNLGGRFPHQKLALVVFGRHALGFQNLQSLEGRVVVVRGEVSTYRGRPEIVLDDPAQLAY